MARCRQHDGIVATFAPSGEGFTVLHRFDDAIEIGFQIRLNCVLLTPCFCKPVTEVSTDTPFRIAADISVIGATSVLPAETEL